MHKFVRDLITEWRKLGLPIAGETIVVAVSGGVDSLSLLLALDELRTRKKLYLRLVAAHFNHKLRGPGSDADEEFVKHLAAEKGFELALGHGQIEPTGNLEQNARNARYAFLTRTAENLKAYGVSTGHTMNDQAETFLLNLIRGSGIDGLRGMSPIRPLNAVWATQNAESENSTEPANDADAVIDVDILNNPELRNSHSSISLIRPLLTWARREDTENFCRECGVEFRYDTMNEDMSFKRVRIRKILLPVLKDLNPKIIETLAQTASLMHQSMSEPPASSGSSESTSGPDVTGAQISISDLKALPKPNLYQTLRCWLRENRGNLRSISMKHIESIERLIHSPKSGRLVELPGGGTVSRQGGRLSFGNIGNIKVDK